MKTHFTEAFVETFKSFSALFLRGFFLRNTLARSNSSAAHVVPDVSVKTVILSVPIPCLHVRLICVTSPALEAVQSGSPSKRIPHVSRNPGPGRSEKNYTRSAPPETGLFARSDSHIVESVFLNSPRVSQWILPFPIFDFSRTV